MKLVKLQDGEMEVFTPETEEVNIHHLWKATIVKDDDGRLCYSAIVETTMDDVTFKRFKIDRMIRIDYIGLDGKDDRIILLALDKEKLQDAYNGMNILLDLQNRWDEIFSEERREIMKQGLKDENNQV
jgi:hypothetical protein